MKNNGIESSPCFHRKGNRKEDGPEKAIGKLLNAILYWLNTGIPWRDLPERFGPWQSVYSQFHAWTKAGVWEQVLSALIKQDLVDETMLMLDSTTVKVHQHASGAKKGDTTKKPDGAGGGLTAKVHRRFATRYEKKALYFHAVVCLACSLVWLL